MQFYPRRLSTHIWTECVHCLSFLINLWFHSITIAAAEHDEKEYCDYETSSLLYRVITSRDYLQYWWRTEGGRIERKNWTESGRESSMNLDFMATYDKGIFFTDPERSGTLSISSGGNRSSSRGTMASNEQNEIGSDDVWQLRNTPSSAREYITDSRSRSRGTNDEHCGFPDDLWMILNIVKKHSPYNHSRGYEMDKSLRDTLSIALEVVKWHWSSYLVNKYSVGSERHFRPFLISNRDSISCRWWFWNQ